MHGDPQQLQELQTKINAAAQVDVSGGTRAGILKAASGNQPSESEIGSAFATAAVIAAAAGGASLAAVAPILAPMALVVFGGGPLLGQAVDKLLGIANNNATPRACSEEDPTQYGQKPGDAGWRTYGSYYGGWQPFTNGSFETWVRRIVMRSTELVANCKSIPGAANIGQFSAALVKTWNDHAAPGTPLRTIPWYLDTESRDPTAEGDPVQQLIRNIFSTYAPDGRASGLQPHPWSIQVADIPAHAIVIPIHFGGGGGRTATSATATATSSTASKVLLGTAIVGGGTLAGAAIYAWMKHRALSSVLDQMWKATGGRALKAL